MIQWLESDRTIIFASVCPSRYVRLVRSLFLALWPRPCYRSTGLDTNVTRRWRWTSNVKCTGSWCGRFRRCSRTSPNFISIFQVTCKAEMHVVSEVKLSRKLKLCLLKVDKNKTIFTTALLLYNPHTSHGRVCTGVTAWDKHHNSDLHCCSTLCLETQHQIRIS